MKGILKLVLCAAVGCVAGMLGIRAYQDWKDKQTAPKSK